MDQERRARLVNVAMGRAAADLCLRGGRVVDVFTRSLWRTDVLIADGHIAAVGDAAHHEAWTAAETIDVSGAFIAPGLIDAHVHIESTLLTPAAFAALAVPRGVTTVIADPHEIANVLGVLGVDAMLAMSEGLPLDCFFAVPSCVPASPFERAGATLDASAIAELMTRERVVALGEMMNFPGVLAADREVLGRLTAADAGERRGEIDGHAPGLLGAELCAYAAAGIHSDHECTTLEEARQRARLGMLVQVREGSMARDLEALLPGILDGSLGRWCLATDDLHASDLLDGYLDTILARLVASGVPAPEAIRHASWVPARHYGLRDRGGVAPGLRADLVVFEDLDAFVVRDVVKDGRLVVRRGDAADLAEAPAPPLQNTVHLAPPPETAFVYEIEGYVQPVIEIVPDQIITTRVNRTVPKKNGRWVFDANEDLALIACLQRHVTDGQMGLGLVSGFGFSRHGALGSSVGHDAHNLLVTGTNEADMRRCTEALAELGGGFVVVRDGHVTATLPLPVAGLLSDRPAAEVIRGQEEVNAAARELGCTLHAPFGTLSFLGLTVIPSLRITDQGVFDVDAFALVT